VIAEPDAPVTGTAIAADGQRVLAGRTAYRRGPDGFPSGGGARDFRGVFVRAVAF